MGRLKLFLPLLIFVVLAGVLYWGLGRDPNAMPSALVNRSVPTFSLPSLNNPEVVLNEGLFKGQVTLLNVWATWCYSCRVEHPFLQRLADDGVVIIGLNYKDDNAAARAWLAEQGDPYQHNIVDADGTLGIDLGVFGAPETYVIDRAGIIRYKFVGVIDERVWTRDIEPVYQRLLR